MKQHNVSTNCLLEADFGEQPYGVTMATASDMMHLFENGTLKQVIAVFVDSMTTAVASQVDSLVERIFSEHRSTCKASFLRTNFKGGATSLTFLNSHHWAGMAFVFYLLLLTNKGRQMCQSCFLEEDQDVPYVPPENEIPKATFRDNYFHPTDYADRLVEESEDEDESEEEDELEEEQEEDGEEDGQGEGTSRKFNGNQMNCSAGQFIKLLEELLVFHAWYRLGDPPITRQTPRCDIQRINKKIRHLIARIVHFVPRKDGNKWRLQKLHETLHLPIFLYYYRHAMNFDAGLGECLLKDFFKLPSSTAQQRSMDAFLKQVVSRIEDQMRLNSAVCANEWITPGQNGNERGKANDGDAVHTIGGSIFTIRYSHVTRAVTFKWNGKGSQCQVHPVLLNFMSDKWGECVGEQYDVTVLTCKTEFSNANGKDTYRAHPDYKSEGPWYDFAYVKFETVRGEVEIPSRIHCFFQREGTDDLFAIVHPCKYQSDHRDMRRRLQHTELVSRWTLDHQKNTQLSTRQKTVYTPKLMVVPVESLAENVLVYEEVPGLVETQESALHVWAVTDRREAWSELFLK